MRRAPRTPDLNQRLDQRTDGNQLHNSSANDRPPHLRLLPGAVFAIAKPTTRTLPLLKPVKRQDSRQDSRSDSETLHPPSPNRKEANLRRRTVPISRRNNQTQK